MDTAATVTCLDVIAQPVSKVQEESGEQQPVNNCQGAQHTQNASPSAALLESDAELPIDTKVDTIATELRGSDAELQTTQRGAIAKDDTTADKDADQEGVELKLHAILSPRILGESTRWDCSKIFF